jgi:Ca-activated chloride channel family protein
MTVATKSFWHALPKPLLFGLYGAFGGLLGATIFGEAVWWLLRPSAPKVAAPPPLRVAASPAVDLYQGGSNRFSVKVAREGWDAPATLKVVDPPAGVRIDGITIPKDRGEAEVEIRATADAAEGPSTITMRAEGPAAAGSPTAETTIQLTVRKTSPPPPALRMGVSPEVVLEQSGQNRFGVVIARDYFSGPVVLDFGGLPQGVTAAGLVVPAEATRIEVELMAAADAAVGTTNVTVTAIGPRGPAETPSPPVAMSRLSLTVNAPKPQPAIDVMFVLDVTGSMQYAIDGVRDGIIEFARGLEESKLDARVGLLAFRDRLETDARFPALMRRAMPKGRAPARSGRKRGGVVPKTAPTPPTGGGSGEEPFLLEVAGEVFTEDYAEFGREVGRKLRADGGGDTPESSLDALAVAAGQEFRKEATRVLILITDAPPKIPDKEMQSVDEVADILKKNEIDQLHLVINDPFRSVYSPLQRDAPGTIFSLQSAARGEGFAAMLPKVSREIARITTASQPPMPEPSATSKPKPPGPPPVEAAKALPSIAPPAVLKSVQSQETFSAESAGRLLLAIGAWTGMITAMIAMALCAGQHRYLKEGTLPSGAAFRGWVGGLVAGLAGGAAGQLLFLVAPGAPASEALFRVLGWTLLGSLAGLVLAFFVPNLRSDRGLLGGAVGGAAGALGFIGVATAVRGLAAADASGRILGAVLLGLALGLTLALAERIARKAWLEICYGGSELRTVNLGLEPVSIGSDARISTIYARGALPVAFRYWFKEGKVTRQDAATDQVTELRPGEPESVGAVVVTVRTAGSAKATTATTPAATSSASRPATPARPVNVAPPPLPSPAVSAPQAAARPANVAPATAPAQRPVAAPVLQHASPASTKISVQPAPAVTARPVSPTPSVAPAKSAPAGPPPAPRDPDKCPSCGRSVPGLPGRRYCIQCDIYL